MATGGVGLTGHSGPESRPGSDSDVSINGCLAEFFFLLKGVVWMGARSATVDGFSGLGLGMAMRFGLGLGFAGGPKCQREWR